jgi:hypothetical protein
MSASPTETLTALVSAPAPTNGPLTATELADLAETANSHTLLGVTALGTRLLSEIAQQVENAVGSLAAVAGPFKGSDGALVTRGSLDAASIAGFANAAARVVQEAVAPSLTAMQTALARAQTELEQERNWSAATQMRVEKLEALADGFVHQERIADHLRGLLAENRGVHHELACICHSARAIARHLCGDAYEPFATGEAPQGGEGLAALRSDMQAAQERMAILEREIRNGAAGPGLRAVIEQMRERVEMRVAEFEEARLDATERATNQHEALRELRAAQAETAASLARFEAQVAEAQELRDLVMQAEARSVARLAGFAAEREEHLRRANAAAERALAISERVERLADDLQGARDVRVAQDERLAARLDALMAASESGLRRSEAAAERIDTLQRSQLLLGERLDSMRAELVTAGRTMLAEAVETRLNDMAAQRDIDALRAEMSEQIGAIRHGQERLLAEFARLEQACSPELRASELGERMAQERRWVEQRIAEMAPPRAGRGNPRNR